MISQSTESDDSVTRDFNDPRYKALRFACFSMWNFCCVLCQKKGGEIECHHVKRWCDYPELRYLVSNTVCLCKDCHKLVTNQEEKYEDLFQKMIRIKLKEKRRENENRQRNEKAKEKKASKNGVKVGAVKVSDGNISNGPRSKIKRNPRSRY